MLILLLCGTAELAVARPEPASPASPTEQVFALQRRNFLKRHRLEIAPSAGVVVNDLFARHYAVGAEASYYLSEALSLGVEAQAFRRQRNHRARLLETVYARAPSVSRFELAAAASTSLVLGHGKLVTLNRWISYWELFARGGVGIMRLHPATSRETRPARHAATVHAGLGLRFFASRWLVVNAGVRDYVFRDGPGALGSTAGEPPPETAPTTNHMLMLQVGVGIYLPVDFSYQRAR